MGVIPHEKLTDCDKVTVSAFCRYVWWLSLGVCCHSALLTMQSGFSDLRAADDGWQW